MDDIAHPGADLSDDEAARLTAGGSMFGTAPIERLGLPAVNMADGPMGVASIRVDERDVSALTPCPTALAASWDLDLVRRVGALVADEARARNVQVMLAPNAGMPRSPLAGRAFETFSEDPFLTGELVAAWIEGLQGRGVGACVKHMVGNDSETQRDTMNAVIDETTLREVYLVPFERAVQAGAWGVLMAYNRVNGVHCVEHRELITDILKHEWRFDGFVVSDWFGTFDTVRSAQAGLDLEMPGPARFLGAKFLEAVEQRRLPRERLDDAAMRMSQLAARADAAVRQAPPPAEDPAALLREAAAAGFVLLKNDGGLLPLAVASGRRVAVIGPNAATPCHQGGTFAKIGLRPDAVSPLAALGEVFGAGLNYQVGVRPEFRLPPMALRPVRDLGDGRDGATVEYFTGRPDAVEPRAAETRNTNALTWFGAVPGPIPLSEPLTVRARGLFTPEVSGPHRLLIGGTGSVRLWVDREERLHRELEVEPKDIMGRLKSGLAEDVEVPLVAGQSVELTFELNARPARAHGLWWGCEPPTDAAAELEAAVRAAAAADDVILIVGETPDAGVESLDRRDTRLPDAQIELIRRVAAANRNTAVVVNAAHAVDLSWADDVAAVMMVWFPGEMFGPALADVLTGAREPGGRLPVTFAGDEADYPAFNLTPDPQGDLNFGEGVRIGYRSFAAAGIEPRYSLGHGLGYGDIAYEDVRHDLGPEAEALVRARILNRGSRPAKAILQVYVTAMADPQPFPRLAGFITRVLAPGEAAHVAVELSWRAFSHWDSAERRWRSTPGRHEIRAGASLADSRLCGTFEGG